MKPIKDKTTEKGQSPEQESERKMNRKEAIRKTGYMALSAATMMLLLSNPSSAATASPASPPVWP